MEKMSKAKTELIFSQPFFASILLSMPIVQDDTQPTLATDGKAIYYNAAYFESLSLSETVFIMAHEVMHCALQHMHTRGDRDASLWNVATDYVINDMLVSERVGTMPDGGLIDSNLVKAGGGTAAGVYDILAKGQQQQQKPQQTPQNGQGQPSPGQGIPGPGQPNGPLDAVLDAGKDAAEIEQSQAEMKVKVIQAQNAAKMCGKMPGGLARLVQEALRTKTDWKSVLRRFVSERAKTDYSYARPNRRFLSQDLYMPGKTGEKCGALVIAVDTSGSIGEAILSKFEAECIAVKQDVCPSMVHVVYFDSEVSSHASFGPDDDLKLRPTGGGGTAFSPIWDYIELHQLDPVGTIVLTDLCCSDFGNAPSYPVLWASTERDGQAPFGEVVDISDT